MGRNRKQLRLCRTITQVTDDSGKKEVDCICRQAYGVETKPVEVDLWVLECLTDSSPCELFVSSSVTIMSESCENVFSLFWSEELGSCGVVIDHEVSGNGDNDSQ